MRTPGSTLFSAVAFIVVGLSTVNGDGLNLFVSAAEVKKLLGLPSEMYYVRDGVVNWYALQFTVLLPADVNDLYFRWNSRLPVTYSMEFAVSNREALSSPQLNVTRWGDVPRTPSTFRVHLPCTGDVSAEVDVTMHVNFTYDAAVADNNATLLTVKRRKVCLKKNDPFSSSSRNESLTTSGAALLPASHVFYLSVGGVGAVLALVSVATGVLYVRSRKVERRRQPEIGPNRTSGPTNNSRCPNAAASGELFRATAPPLPPPSSSSSSGYAGLRKLPPPEASSSADDHVTELSVDRSRIVLGELVHEGTFGRMFEGRMLDGDRRVLLKTVAEHASHVQRTLLVTEGTMLANVHHRNVLPVVALSSTTTSLPLLAFPFPRHGNLKRFLLRCKFSPEGGHVAHVVSTHELVDMAVQIVQGLHFLHRRHLVHRDLATRNCVVDEGPTVRIADNALSRDLFPNDYHCLGDNENRPIRWMAVESVVQRQFSPASDVWSFGVTVWELMTLGQQPYAEVDPFEMAAYLKDGYRLSQPVNCPDELFTLMAYCWVTSPDERPTVLQLLAALRDFHRALGRYI